MSWVRLDVDTPIDERLFGSGFALYWPAVLTRAKKGGGHISRLAASPKQLAALWGSTADEWSAALAYFVEVGLLVIRPDGDGYDVAEWSKEQVDPTNADRQKRHRARESAPTSHDKTVTRALRGNESTVTRPLLPPDATVTTYIHTGHTDTTVAADAATARASADAPAPAREATAAATTPDGLASVVERWRLALRGRTGAAPITVGALDVDALQFAVVEKGADYVTSCIDRAAEVAGGGGPSLSLLKVIMRDGIHDQSTPTRKRGTMQPPAQSKKPDIRQDDDYWAEGREASKKAGGRLVTKVPGVGFVPNDELTAEHIAAVEAAGFGVL